MSFNNRRSSIPGKNSLPLSENPIKIPASIPRHTAKKRPPLSNISNKKCLNSQNNGHCSAAPFGTTVQGSSKVAKAKKDSFCNNKFNKTEISLSSFTKSGVSSVLPCKYEKPFRRDRSAPSTGVSSAAPCIVVVSKNLSDPVSLRSPKLKCIDNSDFSASDSLEKKTLKTLCISEDFEMAGNKCNGKVRVQMEADDEISNVDDNFTDPQFCATIAGDIYKNLRASEEKKRPSMDFMVRIQKDISPNMRAILVDWLVEVSEEYRLVPDTLFLTVNYIDRYLSGNPMDRQRLQLLGIACMMIASKYEEVCAPQVEEFCYITDNTYFREELLQMESAVLKYLKFEMTAPTTKCFLRRFVRVAQATGIEQGQVGGGVSLQFECLANYIGELSLVEYRMLSYAPSMIAAASVFLAKCMMFPSKTPWNRTLERYTLYGGKELHECVMALHELCCNNKHDSTLAAVRLKYSQHKYKFAAKKQCPPLIPPQFFM